MSYLLTLTFVLTPAYTIKLNLMGLPTNLLMLWVVLVWTVFFIWLIAKKQLLHLRTAVRKCSKPVLIFISLFFLAGIISLFINGANKPKLGQFIVLFLQPISIFFISLYIFQQNPKTKTFLLSACYFLLAAAGLYAILQYFTLIGLPAAWWGNSVEPKRALSFFIHPNFYALSCAPLLAFLIPDVAEKIKNQKLEIGNWKFIATWIIGAVGLLLSFSRAGWLGLGIAGIIYLIVAADKKIRKLALYCAIILCIIILAVPNLQWRLRLPFHGEKSAVSRQSLWETGWKGIKESPILGLGLTGFSKNWERLNTDADLPETHNFPHNIFLDFWVETGLLGLISFIGLSAIFIYRGLRSRLPLPLGEGRGEGQAMLKLSAALFLIALISQGLIDNPYFKNDLAMVFWIVLALAI